MEYLWTKGLTPPEFPPLESDIDTDILIIGGGMAGILCAMMLEEAGADYVLVEGERIGKGITKGTTAVLTAQHDILYQDIVKKHGDAPCTGILWNTAGTVPVMARDLISTAISSIIPPGGTAMWNKRFEGWYFKHQLRKCLFTPYVSHIRLPGIRGHIPDISYIRYHGTVAGTIRRTDKDTDP